MDALEEEGMAMIVASEAEDDDDDDDVMEVDETEATLKALASSPPEPRHTPLLSKTATPPTLEEQRKMREELEKLESATKKILEQGEPVVSTDESPQALIDTMVHNISQESIDSSGGGKVSKTALKAQVKTLQNEAEKRENEMKDLKRNETRLNEELENIKKALEQEKKENGELNDQIKQVSDTLKKLQQDVATEQAQAKESEQRSQEEIQKLQTELKEKEKRLEEQKRQYETLKKTHSDEIDRLKKVLEENVDKQQLQTILKQCHVS